jgi:hypothetical protein
MIEDDTIQLAVRNRVLSLAVAAIGPISLASSATGGEDGASAYIGAAGVFSALRVGMEVIASGFPNAAANGAATITHLSSTVATVNRALPEIAAGAGRSLAVGLPKLASWENVAFNSEQGRPYVEEQYLPGPPPVQRSAGQGGTLEAEPQYILSIYIPKGAGISADSKYTNALRLLFPPGQRIALPSPTDMLHERRDFSPNKTQRQFPDLVPGFMVVQFSIPMRLYTPNSI